jgi:hypothetical protein
MRIPGKMYMTPESQREWSYTFFDNDVVDYFHKFHPSVETSILDIGAGGGKYKRLLSEYKNMDAVEVWQPYVGRLKLRELYRNVFVTDIGDFGFDFYDVIILGDVLEHIKTEKAIGLMKRLMQKCHDLVVILPFLNESPDALEGNPHEIHQQSDLTQQVIAQRYPMLKMYKQNEVSGMYIFDPTLRKNYFIQALYDSGNVERNSLYKQMLYVSSKTFLQNLEGVFTCRELAYSYDRNMQNNLFRTFKDINKLWKENANIFYADVDTLCMKPIDIFGKYFQFSEFWISDPPSLPDHPKNMNSGIKYFPAETAKAVMDYGEVLVDKFLEEKNENSPWALDQEIYIKMLDKQGIPFEKFMDNSLNWINFNAVNSTGLNIIERKDAKVLHFHSTRNASETVKIMEEYDRGCIALN